MITSAQTPSKKHSWRVFVCIGIVLAVSAFLLLYKLGAEPFQDYDEATYAEVSTESLASHDYLTFTYNHYNYFEKPPLQFWLEDVSKTIVGDTEFGNRLPSALAAFTLVLVVMAATYAVTQNGYAAALAGGILTTTSGFIEPARQIRFDILVSLFITLSVFAFLKALENRRWFLWYGVFIGLTVLAKGPLVLFAIVPSLAIALTYRSLTWLREKYFWAGILIATIITASWHVYETVLFGKAFWDEYLFGQVVNRVQQVFFTLQPTNAEYVRYFFEFALPWSVVFFAALIATPYVWKYLSRAKKALIVASYVEIATVFAVCFISQTKAFSYLIPTYSFVAIMCAIMAYESIQLLHNKRKQLLIASLSFLLVCGLYNSAFNGFHINPYFAAEVSLAEQEKQIGLALKEQHEATFYTYNVSTIGSIMYYSRMLAPIQLTDGAKLPNGALILYQQSDGQKLQKMYPNETVIYRGSSLAVARLSD